MKLIIKHNYEENDLKSTFRLDYSYYLGYSEYEEKSICLKTEEEVISFLKDLKKYCKDWVSEDDISNISNATICKDIEEISTELDVEEIRFDNDFSVYWFNEFGQVCDVEIEE